MARGACWGRLLTWNPISTRSEMMKAELRLEKPVEQKPDGIVVEVASGTVPLLAAMA